jgi:hypothetical protein
MLREILAEAVADEGRARILLLEPRPLRSVADDEFAARPGHLQECVDVLLDGNAADVGGNGPRQSEELLRMGLEHIGIHAAAPAGEVLEAVRLEIEAYGGGAHHATRGRAVEPAQRAVGQADRDGNARAHVLGKLRVVRSREAHARLAAKAPCAQSQRPLGRDVQRLGRELENAAPDLFVGQQRQADFRVGRAGDAVEIAGGDDPHFVAEALVWGNHASVTIMMRIPRLRWHRGMTKR